jgi:aspartate kinase
MRAVSRIVCKFGGTSVASAAQIRKVRAIVESDAKRRVVVVSAPGKRNKGEAKITDLLYLCHDTASVGADFSSPFDLMRDRFVEIEAELGLPKRIAAELDRFRDELKKGCTKDHAASRGEYFSGLLIAAFLGAEFVEPAEHVRLTGSGVVDPATYASLGARMSDEKRLYVMPGFYGADTRGAVKTFSRGGSDISGAIAARAIHAELYENWTDVSGLLMADPRIVENPRPMAEVTYRELRELAYMGASVLHDEATLPVREVDIPINIRNTDAPDHPGTRIVAKLSQEVEKTTQIAGIAGKRGFSMICIEKTLMNKEVGFTYRLLGVFQWLGISVEHCPSGIDGINVIVEQQHMGGAEDVVIDEIKRTLSPDKITLEPELALIAIVGEGMTRAIGIAAKVFNALRDANVNVRVINQGASEVNIIVGVAPEDFENAMRSLYRAFVDAN